MMVQRGRWSGSIRLNADRVGSEIVHRTKRTAGVNRYKGYYSFFWGYWLTLCLTFIQYRESFVV